MSSLSLYANLSSLPSSLTIRSSSSKGTSLHNNPFNFSFSPCIVAYILCFSSLLNHLFFSSFLWSRYLFETGLEDKVQTYPTRWHIPCKRSLQVHNYISYMCMCVINSVPSFYLFLVYVVVVTWFSMLFLVLMVWFLSLFFVRGLKHYFFIEYTDKVWLGQHKDRCHVQGTEMQVLNLPTLEFYAALYCWFCCCCWIGGGTYGLLGPTAFWK